MGCSSSVSPSIVGEPSKSDHAKYYFEASTQTDETEMVDASVNTTEENQKTDNNYTGLNINDSTNKANAEKILNTFQTPSATKLISSKNQLNMFSNPRLCANPNTEELKWILRGIEAQQYCMIIQQDILSIGPAAIQEAIDAMKKVQELHTIDNDVWNMLEEARRTGDASYLIRAYTAESDFYKLLNRELAKQGTNNGRDLDYEEQLQMMMGNLFKQIDQVVSRTQAFQQGQPMPIQNSNETNWAKLFLRPLYQLLMTSNSTIRYQGSTYRGMWISMDDLDYYTNNTDFICNKAITSTSKRYAVAQGFIDRVVDPSADMVSAMFTYVVESFAAIYALDISSYSLLPEEEEVLLLPGVLFTVRNVRFVSERSVEIELRSSIQDFAEMVSSGLSSLFSILSQ